MCTTCNSVRNVPKTAKELAAEMAKQESAADKKIYVVVEDNGKYYHECYECRLKSNNATGKIIEYVANY